MEGPHAVEISLSERRLFRLRAIAGLGEEKLRAEVSAEELVQNAIDSAEQVLRVCTAARDRSADTQALLRELTALRAEASLNS